MTELWKMSVYAAPFIIAVIILRALFINRLPKKTFVILWAVVLCRLFVPMTLPSPVSIYSLVNRLPKLEAPAPAGNVPQITAVAQAQQVVEYEAAPHAQPESESAHNPVQRQTLLTILWAVGMSGCAAFFLASHLRCRRDYRAALPVDDAFAVEWLHRHPLRRTVRIRQSDQIHAPLTYGLWQPVVLLPKSLDRRDRNQLLYILAHEWTHIRHLDVLWKWLLAAAVCVHWFNPLVWVMYVLANRDIELRCDEMVVRSFGETMKSAYALALIDLEEKRSRLMPLCSNFSKSAIEERIVSIMNIKKTSVIATLLSAVLIVGTTSAFAFGATESAPQATTIYANPSASYVAITEKVTWDYSQYAPFGITYEASADKLYYHGQLIRCFDDEYPIGDSATAGWNHFTVDGVIDVYAVRDQSQPVRNADGSYDPSGVLTGVKPYSQAEFDARRLNTQRDAGSASNNATAYESTPISPDEMAREYSIYEPFGIIYDKEADLLYYQGKLIYQFLDVLATNGEDFASGKFQGAMRSSTQDDGEVSVEVLRDYNMPDADGFGKLIGVEVESVDSFTIWQKGASEPMTKVSIEWWTADEYAAWLAQEKADLQRIIGERSWNETDGWIIWTQEKVDETIRMYERTLEDIQNGAKVSKQVGDLETVSVTVATAPYVAIAQSTASDIAISVTREADMANPASASVSTTIIQSAPMGASAVSGNFSATVKLSNGETVELGTFDTYVERYYAVKVYCEQRVIEGGMTQTEADSIIRQFM